MEVTANFSLLTLLPITLASQAWQDSPYGASQAQQSSPQKPHKLGAAQQGNTAWQAQCAHMAAMQNVHTWCKHPALPFFIDRASLGGGAENED